MAIAQKLDITPRTDRGTGAARAVRRGGLVPGVIYGDNGQPEYFCIDPRIIMKALQGGAFFSTIYTIDTPANNNTLVLVRDVQMHPVTDMPIHMDLLRVDKNAVIKVLVPVNFINEDQSEGLRQGGIMSVVRHEVELNCKVSAVPAELICDLTGCEIGDTIKISHIDLPDGATTVIDRDFVICNIEAMRTATNVEDTDEEVETAEEQTTSETID